LACPGGPPVRGARPAGTRVCPGRWARRLRVAAATTGACVARRRRVSDAAACRLCPSLPLGAGGGGGNPDRAGGGGEGRSTRGGGARAVGHSSARRVRPGRAAVPNAARRRPAAM